MFMTGIRSCWQVTICLFLLLLKFMPLILCRLRVQKLLQLTGPLNLLFSTIHLRLPRISLLIALTLLN